MFGKKVLIVEQVIPIDDENGDWLNAVRQIEKSLKEAMNMVMKKEKMAPTKKRQKPAKKVAQRKYTEADEKYDKKHEFNKIKKNPPGIAAAMNKSKIGYSKKPRVKPSSKTKNVW